METIIDYIIVIAAIAATLYHIWYVLKVANRNNRNK